MTKPFSACAVLRTVLRGWNESERKRILSILADPSNWSENAAGSGENVDGRSHRCSAPVHIVLGVGVALGNIDVYVTDGTPLINGFGDERWFRFHPRYSVGGIILRGYNVD
jgi:hypothetical protein